MQSKVSIFLSALSLLLASCSIDEQLYVPVQDGYIKDSADVVILVKGVYSGFTTNNLYKKQLNYMTLYAHDVFATTNTNYHGYSKRTLNSSNSYIGGAWSEYYKIIKNANNLIDLLVNGGITTLREGYKDRIIAEMHFIRAFCYFELVRLYGEVPIITQPVTIGSDFYVPASSIDEVYARIFSDLKMAEENCRPVTEQPNAERGRGNLGAVLATTADAALTYANHLELPNDRALSPDPQKAKEYYKMAYEYADKVIKSGHYSLLADYIKLFDINDEAGAYKEVIFAIQFVADTRATSASSRGSEFASWFQPTTRYGITGNVTNNKGSAIAKIQPWFYDLCTTGDYGAGTENGDLTQIDYRSQTAFLTKWAKQGNDGVHRITYPRQIAKEEALDPTRKYEINTGDLYPYLNKYADAGGLQQLNNGNDFFIYRLAEMYLIKAEALNEYNGAPTAEAYEALEAVRKRARNKSGNKYPLKLDVSAGLSKEEFRMKIWDERGLEFVGEPKRHYDAVRMKYKDNRRTMMEYMYGDFYKNMPSDMKKALSYNSGTKTYGTGRAYLNNIGEYSRRFLRWPIPNSEKEGNPNIVQNPDFEW